MRLCIAMQLHAASRQLPAGPLLATILNVLTVAASKYNDVSLIFLSDYVVITQNAEPVLLCHHGYDETQAK
jgi:hypothetical protein